MVPYPVLKNNENLRELEGGKYKWLAENINNNETGRAEYIWIDGQDKITSFAKLLNGWTLGIAPPAEEILARSRELQNLLYVLIIVSAVIAGVIAGITGKYISNPITFISEYLQQVSTGDFTKTLAAQITSRNDEIGILGKSIDKMQNNIKGLIVDSQKASYEAKEASEVLAVTSEQTSISIEQVADTVAEIASGSTQQAEDSEMAVNLVTI
ncbi:MAG: HAMP domain-containing protein [Peptococcaceae bacterium]